MSYFFKFAPSYYNTQAWQSGNDLVIQMIAEYLPVTFDVSRGDHQIFNASRLGLCVETYFWQTTLCVRCV